MKQSNTLTIASAFGLSTRVFGIFILSAIGIAPAAFAGIVPITNASFEDPPIAAGAIVNGAPTAWTVDSPASGYWNPATGPNDGSNYFSSVPDGNQIAFAGYDESADINQVLTTTLAADTTYTLTYFVGARYDMPFSEYTVSLEDSNVVLASDSGASPAAGAFVQRTIVYTSGASSGGLLDIDIYATGADALGDGAQADFDLFSLTSAGASGTPEPASLILFGAALIAIGGSRYRHFLRQR